MSNAVYDMVKLEKLADINVGMAMKSFNNFQAYFNEIDNFVNAPKNYFDGYNSTFIIYNMETHDDFIAEINAERTKFNSMGITSLVDALTDLECVVDEKNADSLTDAIMWFNAKAENVSKLIASARVEADETQSLKTAKPIILAVDDKPELLTAIVNMLKGDFTVMAATSGLAAMKMMEKHSPVLFLLDIEMPQMDGYQLAKNIRSREQFANVPIIFLTGKSSRDAVIAAIKNGGNDYIVKPVDREILLEKIYKFL